MTLEQAFKALEAVDGRILKLTEKFAGDKHQKVMEAAVLAITEQGKSAGRAIADALEQFKLI